MNRITGNSQAKNHNGIYIVMVFHTFDWGGTRTPQEQKAQNQWCSRGSCYGIKLNGNVVEQSRGKGVTFSAKF